MTRQGKWLLIGGIIAGVAAAWALGVPLGILLIVAAILACPLVMYFGMHGMGMGQGSRHDRMNGPSHRSDGGRDIEDRERHTEQRR